RRFDLGALRQNMPLDAFPGHQPEITPIVFNSAGGTERVFEQDGIFVEQSSLNVLHAQGTRKVLLFRSVGARAREQVEQIARPGVFADVERFGGALHARLKLIEAHQQINVNFVKFLYLSEVGDAEKISGASRPRRSGAFSSEKLEDIYGALYLVER